MYNKGSVLPVNIDDQTHPGANTQIPVRCSDCGEVFLRERRYLHLAHDCPTLQPHTGYKYCQQCQSYLPIDRFAEDTASCDRLQPVCSECNNNARPRFIGSDTVYERMDYISAAVQPPVRLEVKLLHPDAQIPIRKRTTDAGYDLASIETITIQPRSAADIHTGIAVAIAEGWYYTVDGRSSLILHGIVPYRGVIDSTYCNELMVCLVNISNDPYEVHKGDRIAQIIIHRAYSGDFVRVHEFSPEYNIRGLKGWGSSGR